MSGTGKSSALAELERLGVQVVDTDQGDWTEWCEDQGGYVWREDKISALLQGEDGPPLYVSGTVSNQGRFYDRFDAVVLLSTPPEVILSRIDQRTTNSYGKTEERRELILQHLTEVEPLLRRTCTRDMDASQPLADVVRQLVNLVGEVA
jgi:dephospho-CoA kinase